MVSRCAHHGHMTLYVGAHSAATCKSWSQRVEHMISPNNDAIPLQQDCCCSERFRSWAERMISMGSSSRGHKSSCNDLQQRWENVCNIARNDMSNVLHACRLLKQRRVPQSQRRLLKQKASPPPRPASQIGPCLRPCSHPP